MSPSNLTVEAWPVTDRGQVEQNEDYVLIYQPTDAEEFRLSGSLYVVADGQGGAGSGELASRYAAQKVMSTYYASTEPDLGLRLRRALEAANADLYAFARTQPELVKLGTSVTAAVIRGEQLHVASVGDCRTYIVRDGQAEQITHDHTLVQQLLDEGAISPDEIADHPRRDVVLRTLGSQEEVEIDVFDRRLRPDDAVVLCTDGLLPYLRDDEVASIASTASPRQAAESLVQKAVDRGGRDNVTAVAALVRDGAPGLVTDTPYTWDGSEPDFDMQPTLAMPPVPPEIDETLASDTTVRAEPVTPPPVGDATIPAEPVTPPSSTDRPRPPAQDVGAAASASAGYAIDPVTGLPPVPGAGPPHQPRVYQPPAQPAVSSPQRGVPVGLFALVGLLAILLTAVMVLILLNPFGWQLPGQGGGVAETTEEPVGVIVDTPTAAAESPTEGGEAGEAATEAATDETAEPTAAPTSLVLAPPGMVLVDGGDFMRGVSDEQAADAAALCIEETTDNAQCLQDFFTDAQPVETVTISPFFIDITEVTNADYAECVSAEACTSPDNTEFIDDPAFSEHPVVYVTYDQATQYCQWVGKRLPTEAEWEKAAGWDETAQTTYTWPWGDEWEPGRANTLAAGLGGLSAVEAFARDLSPYGALGMAGNASEWVQDWYFDSYDGLGTLNPARLGTQPLTEAARVARGGNYQSLAAFARTGHRFDTLETSSTPWLGFRCAEDVAGADNAAEGDEATTGEDAGTPAAEETGTAIPEGEDTAATEPAETVTPETTDATATP